MKIIIILTMLVLPAVVQAEHEHPEKYYQERWCAANQGQEEVVLLDKSRADCVTDTHAIAFDFSTNWADSIGPALYYSIQIGKRAGVVLILEQEKDYKYWILLNTIIDHYKLPIDTWIIGNDQVLFDKERERLNQDLDNKIIESTTLFPQGGAK